MSYALWCISPGGTSDGVCGCAQSVGEIQGGDGEGNQRYKWYQGGCATEGQGKWVELDYELVWVYVCWLCVVLGVSFLQVIFVCLLSQSVGRQTSFNRQSGRPTAWGFWLANT